MFKFIITFLLIGNILPQTNSADTNKGVKTGQLTTSEKRFDPLEEMTEEETAVFLELAKRSKEINAREESLKQETLILKVAQDSLNEKLKHFDLLKQDLLKMLNKLKDKEEKEVADLVRLYENMKPKKAANILNQMDIVILKEIIKRMNKRKAALIMAAMDVKKAKDISQMLAKEGSSIS
jgi:flagellar motility protein MotE (MotC chaperone)